MQLFPPTLRVVSLSFLVAILSACGGGGGGGGGGISVASDTGTADNNTSTARMLDYEADIAPILQAKCTGCHNGGENPLAPFALDTKTLVESFSSAIHFTLESGSMPPAGALALTNSEKAKLLAWLDGEAYDPQEEILRVSLIEPLAWDVQAKNRDVFINLRPAQVDCDRDRGWFVEDDGLEVRTEFCNWASLAQQALLELEAGTELQFAFSHSLLNYNAPSTANLALSIGGTTVYEIAIDIPSESNLIKESIILPVAVNIGDPIEINIRNHGNNAYTIHSLEAILSSDDDLTYCPTYDSTFEAIQAVVFEQAGCANSLCHGDAKAGGLDLIPENAWDNLVGVQATGSSLDLVNPRRPASSYLYHKLSAKTFPGSYDIAGAPMPSAGGAITPGQLETIRLWIECGAPNEGSCGDTLGRGEEELERLLGVCLPEPDVVNVDPLDPPEPTKGIQVKMAPHEVKAEGEREICFARYEDFRDVIPEEYLDETGDYFYLKNGETREDPYTHHNLLYKAAVGIDKIHDPAFGDWTCADGPQKGELCEPLDKNSCGIGQCISEIRNSIACRGYGPQGDSRGGSILGLSSGPDREGFYTKFPAHGLFLWNSHVFNLSTKDAIHHLWRNLYFADDRRFQAQGINVIDHITAGTGTKPFEKKTECRDYVFDQGDGLLSITSHTHKRGERFFMTVGDELIYETFTYDEPLNKRFDPAMVFNSPDPAERTLTYCATWNNGINEDGSPNVEVVTRLSRRPVNASPCPARACVAGNIGAACAGPSDNESCDSSPGAGDGWCDACIIMPGASSDDEMFILIGSKMANYDMLINGGHKHATVAIVSPVADAEFAPGDTVVIELAFDNFDLIPPENHSDDNHGHGGEDPMDNGDHSMDDDDHSMGDGDHSMADGDHGDVTEGHYHVYLDTDDDDADHVTDWSETTQLELPDDIAPGPHEIRVSLRAADHHSLGVETKVIIQVE